MRSGKILSCPVTLIHNLEETLFVVLVLVLMTMKTELKSNSQGAVNSEGEGFNLIV